MNVSAREIVRQCGMSDRPGYYSGRGATTSDLDSVKLERIYTAIRSQVSEDAASNFVEMVAALPVASATDFLITLYMLASNDWKWDAALLSKEKGIYPDNETSAFFTIAEVMAGLGKRDQTAMIVSSFLANHGKKTELKTQYGMYRRFGLE